MKLGLLAFLPFVRGIIKGASIYGLETPLGNTVCSWVHPASYYIEYLSNVGFNTLRMPFSYEWVMKGDFSISDEFMETASKFNMWVFLDFHRIWNDQQQPTPESGISLDQFIDAWKIVLYRYLNFNISMNIYNEYQGEDIEYLKNYSTRVMTAIEEEFPGCNLTYALTGYQWSGSLHDFDLEHLPWSDRIRYSVHKYWFSFPSNFDGNGLGLFFWKSIHQ